MPLSDWVRKLFRREGPRAHGLSRRPDDFVQLRVRRMEERRVFSVSTVVAASDSAVNEGSTFTLAASTYKDATATSGPHTATVNWGDGSAVQVLSTTEPASLGADGTVAGSTHIYANNPPGGTYTVTITVTGGDATSANDTILVTVNNVAPTPNANGPYVTGATGNVALHGSATDPGVNDTLTYTWDLDGDGVFGDVAGANGNEVGQDVTFLGSGLARGATQTVSLKVSDGTGESTVTTTVKRNELPTITAVSATSFDTAKGVAPGAFTFTIGDVETPGTLTLSATSSNTAVVTNTPANFTFGTVGPNRTLTLTPVAGAVGTTTITITVLDGNGESSQLQYQVRFNAPPVVTTTGGSSTYTEGATGVVVDAGVSLTDADDTNIESAIVTITNFVAGEDQLVFVDQGTITGGYNPATGILTLTGAASKADYITALQSVKYHNGSANPNTVARTISFKVNDGNDDSAPATKTVTVVSVNSAPSLAGSNGVPAIDEDILNASNTGTLVSDLVAGQFTDADGTLQGIAVVNASNTFGTWQYATDGTTWNTLTGVSTSAARLLAADATTRIRFVPNANFNGTAGGIQIRAWDGDTGLAGGLGDATTTGGTTAYGAQLVSIGITVNSVNDIPVQTGTAPTTISVNEDSNNTTAVTLGLTGLAYTNGGGTTETIQTLTYTLTVIPSYITVWKFDGTTQVTGGTILTFAELQGLKYKTVADANGTGSLTWTVQDDGGIANGGVDTLTQSLTITVTAVNDAPVLPASGVTITYSKNDPATPIDAAITITDIDSTNMNGAVITLTNKKTNDSLVFTNQNGITGNVTNPDANTIVLTLSGSATRAFYEAALQSVRFSNSGTPNTTDRNVTFRVTDSSAANSAVVTRTIHVSANQQPVVSVSGSLSYIEKSGAVTLAGAATVSDADDTLLQRAVIQITGNYVEDEDVLAFSNQNGITGAWDKTTGTLTLTGNVLKNLYQIAIRSVTYENKSNTPSILSRTVTYTVFDGDDDSNPDTRGISITAVNDPPVRTSAAPAAINVNEDSATATAVSLGLTGLTYGNGGSDEGSQTLAYKITSIPSFITLWLADGTTSVDTTTNLSLTDLQGLKYKTVADASGLATNLTWTVKDDGGTLNGGNDTLNQSLSITVVAVNDQPVLTSAAPIPISVLEDSNNTTAVSLGLTGVTYGPGGGSFETAQTLTYRVTAIPSYITLYLADGTTTVAANQALSLAQLQGLKYKTIANANGTGGTVTWTVQDNGGIGNGGVDTLNQSLSIDVTPVNDVPVRTAGTVTPVTVLEDSNNTTAVSLGLTGLTYGPGGGAAESAQTLTYTITVIPSYITLYQADGTTTVAANQTLTLAQLQGLKYKTIADANGTGSSLTWTVQDSGGILSGGVDTLTETLAITVTAVNDPPVRTAGTLTPVNVNEDSAGTTAVSLGLSGLTYGPGGGGFETGQTLTYRVTVIPSYITLYQADGVTQVNQNQTLTLTELQGLTYKTNTNANGTGGTLTWTVQDNGGGANTLTETLAINVAAVDDAPVRTAGTLTPVNVNEDSNNTTAVSLGLTGLTYGPGGGSDEALQTFTYKITGIPSYITLYQADGTTVVNNLQTLTLAQLQGLKYKTNADGNGTGNLTWTVQDSGTTANGGVDTLTETLAINVAAVNDAPTVSNLPSLNVTIRQSALSNQFTFTVNDVDNPLASLTYSAVSDTDSLIDSTTGVLFGGSGASRWVQFNPTTGLSGTAIITITVTDPSLATATFTMTVKVNNPPEFAVPPIDIVINEDSVDVPMAITVRDSETAPASLTVTATSRTQDQTILPNANIRVDTVAGFPDQRVVVVTPKANFNGEVYVTVKIVDGGGAETTATYKITILPVNDAPVVNPGLTLTTREDTPKAGQVGANAGPQETQVLTYAVVTGPQHGTLNFNNSTGAFTYTPTANYSGTDSFTVQVTDDNTAGGSALSTVGTFSLTVTPVADAPLFPVGYVIAGNENTSFHTGLVINLADTDGSEQLTWILIENVDPRIQLRAADGVTPLTPLTDHPTTHIKSFKMLWTDFQNITVYAQDNLPGQALTSFKITATSEETALPIGDADRAATATRNVDVLIRNVAPNISSLFATNVDSNAATSLTSVVNDAPLDFFSIQILWGISKTGFPQSTTLTGLTPGALISQSFTFLVAPNPADPSAPIQILMTATDKDGGVSISSVTIQVPGTGIPTPIVRDLGLIDAPSLLRAYAVPETLDVRTTIPTAPTAINDRRFIAQQITTFERGVELREVMANGDDAPEVHWLSLDKLDNLTEFLETLPNGRYRLYLKENEFTIPRMLVDIVVFRGHAVAPGDLQADRPPRQFRIPATEKLNVPPVAKTPGSNDTTADQPRGGGNGASDSTGPNLSIPGPGLRSPGDPAFPEPTLPPASTPQFNELRGRAP